YNDTWGWNSSSWSPQEFAPDELQDAALAREPATDTGILFGGQNEFGYLLSDAWGWDGAAWRRLAPPNSPPPRGAAALTLDTATDSTLLFGGLSPRTSDFGLV